MNTDAETLYNGSKLTAENFGDFIQRLKYHCAGKGVEWHYTADAIFLVQKKVYVNGIDTEFTDQWCICDHEDVETYYSLKSFIEKLDDDSLEYYGLHDLDDGKSFFDLPEDEQWELLKDVGPLSVSGYEEKWEYLNCHFTKEAAERFIERKKHDYRDGLRVFVDAQSYCWEFNAIKEALMKGQLVFNEG